MGFNGFPWVSMGFHGFRGVFHWVSLGSVGMERGFLKLDGFLRQFCWAVHRVWWVRRPFGLSVAEFQRADERGPIGLVMAAAPLMGSHSVAARHLLPGTQNRCADWPRIGQPNSETRSPKLGRTESIAVKNLIKPKKTQ